MNGSANSRVCPNKLKMYRPGINYLSYTIQVTLRFIRFLDSMRVAQASVLACSLMYGCGEEADNSPAAKPGQSAGTFSTYAISRGTSRNDLSPEFSRDPFRRTYISRYSLKLEDRFDQLVKRLIEAHVIDGDDLNRESCKPTGTVVLTEKLGEETIELVLAEQGAGMATLLRPEYSPQEKYAYRSVEPIPLASWSMRTVGQLFMSQIHTRMVLEELHELPEDERNQIILPVYMDNFVVNPELPQVCGIVNFLAAPPDRSLPSSYLRSSPSTRFAGCAADILNAFTNLSSMAFGISRMEDNEAIFTQTRRGDTVICIIDTRFANLGPLMRDSKVLDLTAIFDALVIHIEMFGMDNEFSAQFRSLMQENRKNAFVESVVDVNALIKKLYAMASSHDGKSALKPEPTRAERYSQLASKTVAAVAKAVGELSDYDSNLCVPLDEDQVSVLLDHEKIELQKTGRASANSLTFGQSRNLDKKFELFYLGGPEKELTGVGLAAPASPVRRLIETYEILKSLPENIREKLFLPIYFSVDVEVEHPEFCKLIRFVAESRPVYLPNVYLDKSAKERFATCAEDILLLVRLLQEYELGILSTDRKDTVAPGIQREDGSVKCVLNIQALRLTFEPQSVKEKIRKGIDGVKHLFKKEFFHKTHDEDVTTAMRSFEETLSKSPDELEILDALRAPFEKIMTAAN